MHLIIVRHGEAKHNLGGGNKQLFAGSKLDSGLTKEGIKTAQELGKRIKTMGYVGLVITSPLKRARQTAEIISNILGDVKIIEIEELKEVDVGSFAGLNKKQVEKKYPEQAKNFYIGDIEKWCFPDGESFDSVNKRVKKLFEKINNLQANNIVICGHGMINRVILRNLFPKNQELWRKTKYFHNRIMKVEI